MKLTTDHIREVFTKKIPESGIIAYYIYKKVGKINKFNIEFHNPKALLLSQIYTNNAHNYDPNINENVPSSYVIEYFDKIRFGK